MKKYEVYKKLKVYSNAPSLYVWTEVTKATWNKYPENKRRIVEK